MCYLPLVCLISFALIILVILALIEWKAGSFPSFSKAVIGIVKEIISENRTPPNEVSEIFPRALDETEWTNFESNLRRYFFYIEYDASGFDRNIASARFLVKKSETISSKETIQFVQTALKKYFILLGANSTFTFVIKATLFHNLLYVRYATSPEGKNLLEK